jgi:hypothetical protein
MKHLHSNLTHLVHIKTFEKELSTRYKYEKPSKGWSSPWTWLNPPKEARVYDSVWGGREPLDKFLRISNYIVTDGKVYLKPYANLWFNNSSAPVTYYRDTMEEVNKFKNKILEMASSNGNFRELNKL